MSKPILPMSVSQDLHRRKFHCFYRSSEMQMQAFSALPGEVSCFRAPESLRVTQAHTADSSNPPQVFFTENQGVSLETSHNHSTMRIRSEGSNFSTGGTPRGPKDLTEPSQVSLNTFPDLGPRGRCPSLRPTASAHPWLVQLMDQKYDQDTLP